MSEQEKRILLADICARFPYSIQILYDMDRIFDSGLICQPLGLVKYNNKTCIQAFGVANPIELEEMKPYLRPMLSMTEEELYEWTHTWIMDNTIEKYDWLNKKHFDYRGLIPMGLALEAPKNMYNTKTE